MSILGQSAYGILLALLDGRALSSKTDRRAFDKIPNVKTSQKRRPDPVLLSNYYLYSSVTGNKITDIVTHPLASDFVSYIYMGGTEIAKGTVNGFSFKVNDPVSGSAQYVDSDGVTGTNGDGREEFGALGTFIPPTEPSSYTPPFYEGGGWAGNVESGCADALGRPQSCASFYADAGPATMLKGRPRQRKPSATRPQEVLYATGRFDSYALRLKAVFSSDDSEGGQPCTLPDGRKGLTGDHGVCQPEVGTVDILIPLEIEGMVTAESSADTPCTIGIVVAFNNTLNERQRQIFKDEISRIYAQVGVTVNFLSTGGDYTLNVNAQAQPYTTKPDAVGQTNLNSDGTVSNRGRVFVDRAHSFARSGAEAAALYDSSPDENLAIALARAGSHEIGHYVLQQNTDDESFYGVMKASFSGRQWFAGDDATKGLWTFDSTQRTGIRYTLCPPAERPGPKWASPDF